MLIGEPPRTPYDLHFRVFGFPVRVHPFFWLMSLLLGIRLKDPVLVMIWAGAVLISILIHELGHAVAIRAFGGDCWITLYSFGGLASSRDVQRSPWQQIIISAAGPLAGFMLGVVIVLLVWVSGHFVGFEKDIFFPISFDPFANDKLNFLIRVMIFINMAWGLLNLLPVYPLDGGQIARELLTLQDPSRGIVQSLWLSVFTGGALVVYGLVGLEEPDIFLALLFGYLAYASYATLQAYTGRGGPRGW